MRPALTMTFLVAALVAFLPTDSSAQTGDRNASSDGASADTAPVEQTRNTEPPSEAEKAEAKRLARLTEAGFDATALTRLHAPVGLAIGARSPAEIALSVMAEITQTLRRGR